MRRPHLKFVLKLFTIYGLGGCSRHVFAAGLAARTRCEDFAVLCGESVFGAGDGNRTHVASLEGWSSTIELHPPEFAPPVRLFANRRHPIPPSPLVPGSREALVEGVGFEPT